MRYRFMCAIGRGSGLPCWVDHAVRLAICHFLGGFSKPGEDSVALEPEQAAGGLDAITFIPELTTLAPVLFIFRHQPVEHNFVGCELRLMRRRRKLAPL